ncbi:cyclin-D3-3 isoform X1 [Nicotiana tabacum]|uniref:Cyclin-D3-1 isoform X1 n=1 Tax=Nicotiana tabacum TaxID=4097 RepID=A0A1S4AKB3_TOBAC|nr:PREDICTED: cyclin-D3-1-like isoform X1 [Nicotiana tabacum]
MSTQLPFLLDALYCEEEGFFTEEVKVEEGEGEGEGEGESFCRENINPNPYDLIWEEGELSSLFSKETENVINNVLEKTPSLASVRREAVEWILKVIGYYSFSAQTAFLAVNYLDRFLSSFEFQTHKPWIYQLVAVACLSLAAKVEETEVPLLLDLQVEESRYVFESKTVQRMELLVLSTLEWKMNPVTPFSFLDYITRRLGLNNCLCWEFLRRCERVLLYTITDCRFIGYLPSAMASATMLHVIDRLQPCIGEKYQDQLLDILGIVKDKVEDCYKLMQEVASNIDFHSNKRKFGTNLPGSPTGVMDVSFSSDYSNDSWSVATSVSSSPEPLSKKTRESRE